MEKQHQISYHIPDNSVFYQEIIKKSRFIVHIAHTNDVEAAKKFISEIKEKYSDAGHNCWAYIAGDPSDSRILGFSDDGEPNGTAGKPMLNVLMGSGIGEITAVVTRYFGGIKLGTGGLVRAYGGSLNNALNEIQKKEKITETVIKGSSEYSHQTVIERILESYTVLEIRKDFKENIDWEISIDIREAPLVVAEIQEKTSGRVNFVHCDEL